MEAQRHWLAVALNWLGLLWLVGWTLYVTFAPDDNPGMSATLAGLLIPTFIAFAVSWVLNRLTLSDVNRKGSPSPSQS